ncbi:MAG: MBL fold metallo-hydrolase [Lysobacterales bacterium]|nr:MAG: MBL fold metallo-hydrolase [Xanthomonadales bacterium]
MRTVQRVLATLVLSVLGVDAAHAELRTTHVSGNVYLITGAGGNVAVSVGTSGVMIVDSGSAEMSGELLTEIRKLGNGALRYIINTNVDPEHMGGNAPLRAAGATFTGGNATVVGGVDVGAAIVAHETALLRLANLGSVPVAAQPTETFYVPKVDFFFNGEPVEVMYKPAVDDTNIVVHFRRSDVLATGDLFRLDGYPVIDLKNGGSIQGVLDALNAFVDLAVSDTLSEGGTMLIPGHGRICDEADLVRYRDMLTIIRDRIAALKERGRTLAQVKAAKPTLDYDSRFGRNPEWTGDDFIEAVYASLGS